MRLFLFWLLPLWLASIASAETFEQRKAEFEEKDTELNSAYQAAKDALPAWRFSALQDEQRSWIEYRDERALQAAFFDGQAEQGKEKANPEYWHALAYLTETRIEIVKAWMKIDDFPREWEGVWSDGVGGELFISEAAPGRLELFLSVVRGPTYHLGMIGGEARSNGTTAWFSTQQEGAEEETWLTLVIKNGRMEVSGENTQPFHGARAYFDGTYIRLRQLTAEDKKMIEEQGGY